MARQSFPNLVTISTLIPKRRKLTETLEAPPPKEYSLPEVSILAPYKKANASCTRPLALTLTNFASREVSNTSQVAPPMTQTLLI